MNTNFAKHRTSRKGLILGAIIIMVCSQIFLSCALFQSFDMSSSGRAKQQVRVAAVGVLGCKSMSDVDVTEAGTDKYLAKGCDNEAIFDCSGPTCVNVTPAAANLPTNRWCVAKIMKESSMSALGSAKITYVVTYFDITDETNADKVGIEAFANREPSNYGSGFQEHEIASLQRDDCTVLKKKYKEISNFKLNRITKK